MLIDRFSFDLASNLTSLALRLLPLPLSGLASRRPTGFRDAVGLRAKAALDKTVCLLHSTITATASAQEWRRIVREVAEAGSQWDAHEWTDHPELYHIAPPALHSPHLRRDHSRAAHFLHLQFESGYEPRPDEPGRGRWLDYRANRTAHAWVFRHPGHPRPWLMGIHGYGMGIPLVDIEAFRVPWLYHDLGLNVILPVLPFHGPRRVRWQSGDGFITGDMLDTIHAEAQTMWDLRRMLSWVRAQEATSIGIYGLSLGGYNAALLAALEPDLACVIAGIPAVDFVRLILLHAPAATLLLAKQAGMQWDEVGRICRVISPLALAPRVRRDRRFIFAGIADCIVPQDQARDLWEHWQRPRIGWYQGSHLSFHWETTVTAILREAIGSTLSAHDEVPGHQHAA